MIVVRRARWAISASWRRGEVIVGARIGERAGVHSFKFTQAARNRAERERLAAIPRLRAAQAQLEQYLDEHLPEWRTWESVEGEGERKFG